MYLKFYFQTLEAEKLIIEFNFLKSFIIQFKTLFHYVIINTVRFTRVLLHCCNIIIVLEKA